MTGPTREAVEAALSKLYNATRQRGHSINCVTHAPENARTSANCDCGYHAAMDAERVITAALSAPRPVGGTDWPEKANDITYVEHRIAYLNDIRLYDGTPEGDEAVDQKLKELWAYRRILAALTSSGGGGTAGEVAALREVANRARQMPRRTPAPGGAGTVHNFAIEAGYVWMLDLALTALDAALSGARVPEGGEPRNFTATARVDGGTSVATPTPVTGYAPAPVAGSYRYNALGQCGELIQAICEAGNHAFLPGGVLLKLNALVDALQALASPAPTAASGAEMPQVTACIEAVKEVDWPVGSENASGGWSEGFGDGINAAVAALRALAHPSPSTEGV